MLSGTLPAISMFQVRCYMQELVQLNKDRIQQLTSQTQAVQNLDDSASVRPDHPTQASAQPSSLGADQQLAVPRIVPVEEPATTSAWLPVGFSEFVTAKSGMTKLDHAGQPWILFRTKDGQVGCIEDCCAHRACPLSLVSAPRNPFSSAVSMT